MTPNLLHFGAEMTLWETVGGCRNLGSKDLNNPSQSKTQIRNWTKRTSVTGKTHRRQKRDFQIFPGINRSRSILILSSRLSIDGCIYTVQSQWLFRSPVHHRLATSHCAWHRDSEGFSSRLRLDWRATWCLQTLLVYNPVIPGLSTDISLEKPLLWWTQLTEGKYICSLQ